MIILLKRTFIVSSVLTLFIGSPSVVAHPGIGIVMDSRGNVYYTDLKHVWKISPDGEKSVAVHNVHTHELYIDAADNLCGEHLWYNGEAADTWGHRVWRLAADGTLSDIIPSRKGFLDDYNDFHFVHDRQGNMYYADRGETTFVRKRSQDGNVTTIAGAAFRDVRWMTATPEGILYLIDLYDLVRITPDGAVTTVARDLAEWKWNRLFGPDRHALMGLWTDPQGIVYVANFSGNNVKKVTPDGQTEIAVPAHAGWSPTGGLISPGGDTWLLEYSVTNAARIHRIDKNGKSTVYE